MTDTTDSLSLPEAVRLCPVEVVSFRPASTSQQDGGVLGWLELCVHGGLVLRDIQLRRKLGGELYLRYPTRHSNRGREHSVYYPKSARLAEAILVQVRSALRSDVGRGSNSTALSVENACRVPAA